MLAGCAIIPLLFLLRRSLEETQTFLVRSHHPTPRQVLGTLVANWRLVLLGVMLVTTTTVYYYMITAYTPTFGSAVLHLAFRQTMMVTLCVGASNLFWVPVMGLYLTGSGGVRFWSVSLFSPFSRRIRHSGGWRARHRWRGF